VVAAPAANNPVTSVLALLAPNDPLHQEMEHLLANNHHPQRVPSSVGPSDTAHAGNHSTSIPGEPIPLPESEELTVVRAENAQLRARVEELEQILEATTNQTEQMWAEHQQEYEMLLDEKSEVIRSLHQQLQEAKSAAPAPQLPEAVATASDDADAPALRQELNALREQMERERQQLEEDEKSLMDQMREMELAMSKERVEMARQRGELQRLYQDLQHEIEQAQKDGGLRERLMALQRRSQAEAAAQQPLARNPHPTPPAPRSGQPPAQGQQPPARRALPTQAVLPGTNGEAPGARPGSGFIRRLFG
jgi:hypothetical protein